MAATKAAPLCLTLVALLITVVAAADAYTNHTVGADAGWFFDAITNKTAADYKAWAANSTFNLGDYLSSNDFGSATIVAVPLTIAGTQYYFSDADDGTQCQNGMAFQIMVNRGLGLPPSLNQPPPPAYVPPPGPATEGQSPPVMVVASPSNDGMGTRANFFWLVPVLLSLLSFLT